jgi:hypothetical protein
VVDGTRYRAVNVARLYTVSSTHRTTVSGSLIDRGANGGIAGDDVRVIEHTMRTVDVRGIDNHEVTGIPIVTAGGVVKTQHGPVIAILSQYAYLGSGKTIHSAAQLEHYQNDVNDRSIKVHGGLQRILTLDGYVIPINIVGGLPYISMRPYTDDEWDRLPHVILTSDLDWDPTVLDHTLDDDEHWYDAMCDLDTPPYDSPFDSEGTYHDRVVAQTSTSPCTPVAFVDLPSHDYTTALTDADIDAVIDRCVYYAQTDGTAYSIHNLESTVSASSPRTISDKDPDYEALRPYFGWLPLDTIKETFARTTQYARMPMSTYLKRQFKSPYPALNVHRRHEPVATDTVYSDTPAIDGGERYAQLFIGTESLVTDVEGMKTDKQFVNTLEDNIRRRGAPTKLISDSAKVEISNKVKDILRALCISDWQSEPHQQQQNPAERRYQTIKSLTNIILDRTGSPASLWLLCLMYVCFLLNNTSSQALSGAVPIQVLTGSTNDISPLLQFRWYEPVYYLVDDSPFPSDSREKRGYFVGIAEHVGHAMTFKVLTDDTRKIIYRSNIRSAADSKSRNLRLDPLNDTVSSPIIRSRHDSSHHGEGNVPPDMPIIDPHDLVGRTFLLPQEEDGQRFRARIVKALDDYDSDLGTQPERIRFLCAAKDGAYEEILSYSQLMDSLESQEDGEGNVWKFRRITGHQGPLLHYDKDYNGSLYNVMIEWENGEVTAEPLSVIAKDDPITCAIYARDNNLLDLEGWRRFKSIANRELKFRRLVNQAKLRSYRLAP